MRRQVIRVLAALSVTLGTFYVGWRWLFSVNWPNWWIAVPLVVAETYTLIDAFLFGLTVWRVKHRGEPPDPPAGLTVDVFVTTYNEPVELVETTANAACRIAYPHQTWILDDGARAEMRELADRLGIGYIVRSQDWVGKPRHAKAGNLNNALLMTNGEFMLILDADQVPYPRILDRTLGYFDDPKVAFVQTPQWFDNVTESDPLGSQARLFYGPIQQGKDGWNAAFFCGSNGVLRREAIMELGVVGYVREVDRAVRQTLGTADRILRRAAAAAEDGPATRTAIAHVRTAVAHARTRLADGDPVAELTYEFQRRVDTVAQTIVAEDLAAIRADLEALGESAIDIDDQLGMPVVDDQAMERLATRDWSPLGAVEAVQKLVTDLNIDRAGEAHPVMPVTTASVTEDMATSMRLHAQGWASVYHPEILADGLAPEDLRTMLRQRLRWAQGTIQIALQQSPLTLPGLTWPQRLMYLTTIWTYLSGFATVVFLAAPVIYLCFGVLPVRSFGIEFIAHFVPYFVVNQLLFLVVGYGFRTWRGHQYSVALFPLWIQACVTAAANVWFGRPLGFAVTPKTRQHYQGFAWRSILPQLVAIALLVVACVAGVARLLTGNASALGVSVNLVWSVYNLVILSVVFQAARYQAPERSLKLEA
ncbi:glycosyltransferase family protein [Flindersiella endophytica]